jgi:hypothetical protein
VGAVHGVCTAERHDPVVDTANCVRCGKPATKWSGWVELRTADKIKKVTAGWCSYRCLNFWRTCHGRYDARVHGKAPRHSAGDVVFARRKGMIQ